MNEGKDFAELDHAVEVVLPPWCFCEPRTKLYCCRKNLLKKLGTKNFVTKYNRNCLKIQTRFKLFTCSEATRNATLFLGDFKKIRKNK